MNQDDLVKQIPENSLAISEIFYSIQGEGRYSGTPMIFIRTNICFVGCKFCDTKYTWENVTHNKFYASASLIRKIEELSDRCKHVCITGGEPLEQVQYLLPICKDLQANGLKIHLETSGYKEISKEFADVCHWIVCSPKRFHPLNFFAPIQEVKILVTKNADVKKIRNWVGKFKNKVWISIQPIEPTPLLEGNPEGLDENQLAEFYARIRANRIVEAVEWELNKNKAIEICKQTGWNLSFQLHKYLGVR